MASIYQKTIKENRIKGVTTMTKYFRITAYWPKEDISIIMDTNGLFEKLWQFSADLVAKGFKIIEVSTDENFIDINIKKLTEQGNKYYLRASCSGRPIYRNVDIDGSTYKAIYVDDMGYIPN